MLAEVRSLAQQHGREAVGRLVDLMRSDNEPVAVRAAVELLDRGYGRPIQGVSVAGDTPPVLIIGMPQLRHDPMALPAPRAGDEDTESQDDVSETVLDVSAIIERFGPKTDGVARESGRQSR